MRPQNQQGSVLILVLIAALILTIIGLSALTQTGTEAGTARNFQMDKTAFYLADGGVQYGLNEIKNVLDPTDISFKVPPDPPNAPVYFITGRMNDTSPQPVSPFKGFTLPTITGLSIDQNNELAAQPTPWRMIVSSSAVAPGHIDRLPSKKQISLVLVTLSPEY